jgi:hypothetical protein
MALCPPSDVGPIFFLKEIYLYSAFPARCGKLRVTTGLIIVAQEFIIGCTSYSCYIMPALMTVEGTLFLRVYALYNLNRRIMYLLLCAGVVIMSVGAVSVVQHFGLC